VRNRKGKEIRQVDRGGSLGLDPEMTRPYCLRSVTFQHADADVVDTWVVTFPVAPGAGELEQSDAERPHSERGPASAWRAN